MKKALFPGTFDPPTLGHIEIILRSASLCDQLIIGIGKNLKKGPSLLSDEEKMHSLKKATQSLKNVEIAFFSGLVSTFAKKQGVCFLIRGLRFENDFASEMQLAHANKVLGIETLFLITDESAHISSTLIRELAVNRAPLKGFVPEDIINILYSRLMVD